MKIAHLCNYDSQGGAAICAYRVCEALRSQGADVSMFVRNKYRSLDWIFQIPSIPGKFSDKVFSKLRTLTRGSENLNGKWMFDYLNQGKVTDFSFLNDYEVVHLHWIAEFIDLEALLEYCVSNRKKIFWTLHDMWAFTGGCYFTKGCQKFTDNCAGCHFFKDPIIDYPRKEKSEKKRIINKYRKNIQFICPSRWMENRIRQAFDEELRVVYLSYAYPFEIFNEKKKAFFYSDKINIAFPAHSLDIERKNCQFVFDKLKSVGDNIRVVAIGNPAKNINFPYEVISTGFVNDENLMSHIYSSCDFGIVPSIEDNSPNVLVEMLMCGIPVLGSNVGGIPEVLTDEFGCLFDPFDGVDFVENVKFMSDNYKKFKKFSDSEQSLRYTYDVVAKEHLATYKAICN